MYIPLNFYNFPLSKRSQLLIFWIKTFLSSKTSFIILKCIQIHRKQNCHLFKFNDVNSVSKQNILLAIFVEI